MKITQAKSLLCTLALVIASSCSLTADDNHFHVTNLVSDLPGLAPNIDPNLVNPWGLVFDTHGNLVVADNGTSLATSYTQDGTILSFVINVPGDPSGLDTNDSEHAFLLSSGPHKHPAHLLFSTESGTILGFNKNVNPNNAIVVADRSSFDAVYKGLAIAKIEDHHFLYATDFHNGQVDVFDAHFNYQFSFTDDTIPEGFAPFNIRNFDEKLYVTYAKQFPPDNHDDMAGPGNGFIDIFTPDGTLIKRLVSNGELNSPWGLAIAPEHFGDFGGKLLVGNFGNGIINVYHPWKGNFLGQLKDESGGVITIQGLWAIRFEESESSSSSSSDSDDDDTTLYFTSGPFCESDGILGKITPIDESLSSSSSSSSSSKRHQEGAKIKS